jgi:Na+/melibiose symporter-like transporter
METTENLIESLLERATEYGKTSYELIKLKSINKISDLVSSILPNSAVLVLMVSFVLFLSFGLAFFLGKIFENNGLGFFAIAAFYGIIGIVMHFIIRKWLKKRIKNYINKQLLK